MKLLVIGASKVLPLTKCIFSLSAWDCWPQFPDFSVSSEILLLICVYLSMYNVWRRKWLKLVQKIKSKDGGGKWGDGYRGWSHNRSSFVLEFSHQDWTRFTLKTPKQQAWFSLSLGDSETQGDVLCLKILNDKLSVKNTSAFTILHQPEV